jgi:N-acetylneuraminic acid mutarotase
MIVWGGRLSYNNPGTGGRYDPTTDSWEATSTIGAPQDRADHVAVWTGSEMIVWGGYPSDGGRYDPVSDRWEPMATEGQPAATNFRAAIWTGSEMIVWGGDEPGGRYEAESDRWSAISSVGEPEPRIGHSAVWTGSEMLVWGGQNHDFSLRADGGRYDPASDSWSPISMDGAPAPRHHHTAVWTGTEMIVWGGRGLYGLSTGGRYRPDTDSWLPTDETTAPPPTYEHTAVWTGGEMIVWGGGDRPSDETNIGGRYDPSTDSWTRTGGVTPTPRIDHVVVWTGTEMIVWGGSEGDQRPTDTGARYDPTLDDWIGTSTENAARPGTKPVGVWTGTEMIVWHGYSQGGGRYDPRTDSWSAMSRHGAPTFTSRSVAWSGREFLTWGGGYLWEHNDGGRYDPSTDTWRGMSTNGAPSHREGHSLIWTGAEMVVWGGRYVNQILDDGGLYDSESDSWRPITNDGVPDGRFKHSTVWTGDEMIIWGGTSNFGWDTLATGGRYNPTTDTWLPTSTVDAPAKRDRHAAVWSGDEMLVWGGTDYYPGGRYDPIQDLWQDMTTQQEPTRRRGDAIWTGSEMIIWGGEDYPFLLQDGGAYCARSNEPPTAEAGVSRTLECEHPLGARTILDGSASFDPDSTPGTLDDIASFDWFVDYGQPSQHLLGHGVSVEVQMPLGVHSVTLRVIDYAGEVDTDEIAVTVLDRTPPGLTVDLSPTVLWPPDHSLRTIEAVVNSHDVCGETSFELVSITCNEPDMERGRSELGDDIVGASTGAPDTQFMLRAERSGYGNGRIYSITYKATDASGNEIDRVEQVRVPHDASGGLTEHTGDSSGTTRDRSRTDARPSDHGAGSRSEPSRSGTGANRPARERR